MAVGICLYVWVNNPRAWVTCVLYIYERYIMGVGWCLQKVMLFLFGPVDGSPVFLSFSAAAPKQNNDSYYDKYALSAVTRY